MHRSSIILLLALVLGLSGCGRMTPVATSIVTPTILSPTTVLSPTDTPSPTVSASPVAPTASASTNAPWSTVVASTAEPRPSTANLGQSFEITVGQTVTVGADISVTLNQITQDSRCPKSVACFWSGAIQAAITIQQAGQTAQTSTLTLPSIPDGPDRVDYAGLTIQFVQATPYPETPESTISQAAYVVTLIVAPIDPLSPTTTPLSR